MGKKPLCLVALGANLMSKAGPPADTLRAALSILHTEPNISICAISEFWTTPAYPAGSGPDYCNAAAILDTGLDAATVLERLHEIEARFGRTRQGARWQSRPLDLDLIAYGDQIAPDRETQSRWAGLPEGRRAEAAPDQLILPHPRMAERGFVLAPMAQVAPGWRHPITGMTVADMLAALPPDALAGMRPIATG